MLQNKQQIFSQSRVTQAVLGVSRSEFEQLLPTFAQCLIQRRNELKPDRIRRVGCGRKGDLPTDEDKLLFILLYLKLYPTYDALAVLTGHQRSKCGDSVKLLLPVLEKTLGRHFVLPVRRGRSLEEIFRESPELKDVFIDGTERRVNKPKKLKKRDKLYSGKKKSHTRKAIVVSDARKRIMDKNLIANHIPESVTAWADTGFIGMQLSTAHRAQVLHSS